jgi:glutamine synthetase adenylyltransferase
LVTENERDRLIEAYALYRRLELHIRITLGEHGSILPVQARLDTLARCAVRSTGAELATRIQLTMTGVRALFLEIAERISRSVPPP